MTSRFNSSQPRPEQTGTGRISTQDAHLVIQCPNRLWISLRRMDGLPEPAWVGLDATEITPSQLAVWLPLWATLVWQAIEPSDLSSGEWTAQHAQHNLHARKDNYRINLYGDPGSSMGHEEVMRLWRRFMGDFP